MYQDATGTVPVTGVGQPVGLVLDKSKGLKRGFQLVSGSLQTSRIGSISAGTGGEISWELNTVNPLSGTQDAILKVTTPSETSLRPLLSFTLITPAQAGKTYELSFRYRVKSGTPLVGRVFNGSGGVLVNQTLTGEGIFKTYILWTEGGDNKPYIYFANTSVFELQMADISFKEVQGNHAYQTSSASRPILRKNSSTGAYYLEFDGSDDFLQTNNIDFTATDKVSLFAGVRKLSDAAVSTVVELSANLNSNNSSFYLAAPDNLSSYRFASKGTLPMYGTLTTASGYAAPISSVISAKGSISQDYSEIRIDSAQKSTTTVDQGTGNYGNYPLYIGRRGGASLPFNGRIYGLIGIGKLTSDSETVAIEKELAKRTGVTLNV